MDWIGWIQTLFSFHTIWWQQHTWRGFILPVICFLTWAGFLFASYITLFIAYRCIQSVEYAMHSNHATYRCKVNQPSLNSSPPQTPKKWDHAKEYPGVSMIKPLKGLEPCLEENLESFFTLSYPLFEILVCIGEKDDPAQYIVEKLMEKYQKVNVKLFVGAKQVGVNPKINNMLEPYEHAQYDFIWTTDSNVFVSDTCLYELVEILQRPGIGFVHQLPAASCPPYDRFGGYLEAMYLSTSMARIYILANKILRINCAMGKSLIFKKSVHEKLGGLVQYRNYLAEDFYIGKTFQDVNLSVVLASEPVHQCLCDYALSGYIARRVRWSRLRKYMVPLTAFFEPISESLPCGALGAYGASVLFGVDVWKFFFLHLILWFTCDMLLFCRVTKYHDFRDMHVMALAWIVRELTYIPLYIYGLMGRRVVWRGNIFRLYPGGLVEKVIAKGQQEEERRKSLNNAQTIILTNEGSTPDKHNTNGGILKNTPNKEHQNGNLSSQNTIECRYRRTSSIINGSSSFHL